jgi:leucine dehydrogenase
VSVAVPALGAEAANGARPGSSMAHSAPAVAFDHEEVVVRRGARSGLHVIVAIHSTALGPALGGLRIWHYASPAEAVVDALRLASGMTLKAAVAGLDLGGGKGVICAPAGGPPNGDRRTTMLHDFGDLVESLEGRYVSAEDVGTSPGDLVTIAERTGHLTGLPPEHGGSGDPSPFTALGVESALRACALERFGTRDLGGMRIGVIGLGHVGAHLARRLKGAGAEVVASDVAPGKRAEAMRLGVGWADPDTAMEGVYDVLAPCALGGCVDAASVEKLRCAVVCGAANNQLASDAIAERLAERGIIYAPDYIVNAGGLIHVYMEIRGYDESEATVLATGIEDTLARVFDAARAEGTTPLRAAGRLAAQRLARAEAVAQVAH